MYSRFKFVENTISNSPKVLRAKFLESDGLFYFFSICKFDRFKNPFTTITSLSELYLSFISFILLITNKKTDFYNLRQQHKQLKTTDMKETLPYTYDD